MLHKAGFAIAAECYNVWYNGGRVSITCSLHLPIVAVWYTGMLYRFCVPVMIFLFYISLSNSLLPPNFEWLTNVIFYLLPPSSIDVVYTLFNSLAPGGFENIFQNVFFKLISWIDTLSNSCETALRSMPQNPSDDKSTLVQVMAWCRQAASHYLSQCCPRSLSPYGVTRPQWVNWPSVFPTREG